MLKSVLLFFSHGAYQRLISVICCYLNEINFVCVGRKKNNEVREKGKRNEEKSIAWPKNITFKRICNRAQSKNLRSVHVTLRHTIFCWMLFRSLVCLGCWLAYFCLCFLFVKSPLLLIVFDVYGDCHNVLVGQKRNNNVKTITLYTKIDFPYSISSSVACECVRSLLYASRAHTSYHAGAAAAAIFRNVCESVAAYRTLSLSIAFTNVFVCQWARKKMKLQLMKLQNCLRAQSRRKNRWIWMIMRKKGGEGDEKSK